MTVVQSEFVKRYDSNEPGRRRQSIQPGDDLSKRVKTTRSGENLRFHCETRMEWLVLPARFQRATFRLGGGRSMQLSYGSTRSLR